MTETRKIGGRVLRAGDVVKIAGQRAAQFLVLGFDDGTVEVYGGRKDRAPLRRTFPLEAIGTRVALAGSDKADGYRSSICPPGTEAPRRRSAR